MVATFAQRNFAASTINYFNIDLEKGNKDPLKALVKAVIAKESSNNLSAKSITKIIQESYNELAENGDTKSKAVVKAAGKLTGKSKFDSYQEEDFKKDVAKALKDYAFINDILENIPNKATGVLKNIVATFNDYESSTLTGDKLEAADAYAQIIVIACGSGPFVTGDEIPEPVPAIHSCMGDEGWECSDTYVRNCLDQGNKIAYTVLQDVGCGSDKLDCFKVKESCYYAIADRLYDLYNRGNVDEMRIDLMGEYPYAQVFEDSADLPKIKNIILDNEVNECLRAKKKQIEQGLEKLLKANDVMEGIDPEAIKYNAEVLDKIVDKIKEKKKVEVLDDNKKKEMDDWLVYAKEQMEEKDREIMALKEKLKECESLSDTDTLENENINNQENDRVEL